MPHTYFELGRSGHDACASCAALVDLLKAGDQLAPGDYWVCEVTQYSAFGFRWETLDDEPMVPGTPYLFFRS